ncbi:hypothetical protein AGMMS49525_08460 [Bacteroidia bacterium]|nr:hypothetical protein AGMMS49525_08460 [Bacteroidia bacterium]
MGSSCDRESVVDLEISNPALQGIRWQLIAFVDEATGSVTLPLPESETCDDCFRIYFNTDKTFDGKAFANSFTGTYELGLSTIRITPTMVTKILSKYEDSESLYIDNLTEIQSFSVTDNELRLYYKKQNYLLFKPYDSESVVDLETYKSHIVGKWKLIAEGASENDMHPIESDNYVEYREDDKIKYYNSGVIVEQPGLSVQYKIDSKSLYHYYYFDGENFDEDTQMHVYDYKFNKTYDELTLEHVKGVVEDIYPIMRFFTYKKEITKNNQAPLISDISYSSCKNELVLEEYIKYYAANDSTLRFEHKQLFNCAMDSCAVKMEPTTEGVVIDVLDYGNSANCICPVIVNYDITSLKEGNTYLFTFRRHAQELHTSTITFTANINSIIKL